MLHSSVLGLTIVISLVVAGVGQAAGLPDAKTGGAKGGPIAILFLSETPLMDKAYGKELRERGYVYANANYFEPLAPEFLDKFNVFVFADVPRGDKEFFPGGEKSSGRPVPGASARGKGCRDAHLRHPGIRRPRGVER